MVLKYELHRLEVKFRSEIEHGKILIVERLGYRGLFEFTICEMFIKLLVRLDVPFDVHAHERDELDETRIDPSKGAGIAQWHRSSERALKPVDRPLLGEFVDLGRIHPRVDRPGHQGHGAGLCWIAGLCHYRAPRQYPHAARPD